MSKKFSILKPHQFLGLALAVAISPVLSQETDIQLPSFTIGSKAPDLDIEHWYSDGEGKFEHTTRLKSDTVYVIEFWATWCGPCIASMPHLSETQAKYSDKGVQLISISDEKLETVEKFMQGKVRGNDEMTYAELTKNYCVGVDPDRSVMETYFRAAGQRGIPCAFIVGREGVVEWIGHPMRMDAPLAQVVDGSWDREAFAVVWKETKIAEAKAAKLQTIAMATMNDARKLMAAGDTEEALTMLDELIADEEMSQFKGRAEMTRDNLIIEFLDGGEVVASLERISQQHQRNAIMLNRTARLIYDRHQNTTLDRSVIEAAVQIAEKAVSAAKKNSDAWDTLAKLASVTGDLQRAIEAQEQAIEHASDDEKTTEMKTFLEKLKSSRSNS